MTSAIGSYGGYQNTMPATQGPRPRRQNADEMAADLFKQLATNNQGYIQASDLSSALSSVGDTTTDGQALFKALDSDNDGKVTQEEVSSALKKIEAQMGDEFNAMRTQGMPDMMAGGMPPPPPPKDDNGGLDQSQLSSLASDAASSGDTSAANRFASLAANFDSADSNGDGKVSFQESIAFEQTQRSQEASAGSSDNSNELIAPQALQRLMGMLRQYDGANITIISQQISIDA
ncbi:EF-hand domain-containing protein [Vogesella oryzae]|uniref:EF-hand domain-containing protein n=1 Tax=Vogesella oryzae TaxID=1735285 RepID=UPI00158291A7|nr:EF-hand domain-containing protein [Vogesella oryzae]